MGAASHGGTDARGFDKEFTRWTVPNVETLSGNKTITSTDARVQLLNPGAAGTRFITLDASLHVVGTKVTVQNMDSTDGAYNYGFLQVRNSAAVNLHSSPMGFGTSLSFIYTGTGVTGWVRNEGLEGSNAFTNVWQPTYNLSYLGPSGQLSITSTGVGVAGSAINPSSLFHVTAAGNASALRVDNTTGKVSIGTGPWSGSQVLIQAFAASNALVAWDTPIGYYAFGFSHTGGTYYSGFSVYGTGTGALQLTDETGAISVLMVPHSSTGVNTFLSKTGIGASPSSLFHVTASGNANALRVDNTTGNTGFGASPDATFNILVQHNESGDAATVKLHNTNAGASAGTGLYLYNDGSGSTSGYLISWSAAASGNDLDVVATIGNLRLGASATTKSITFSPGVGGRVLCQGTTSAFRPNVLTTTERDALTPFNGDFIYNSTTGKHEGYNGAWNACY